MKDSPFSRRRKPDEIPTARRAIRYFCAECMGWNVAEVRECTDPKCWLYPWRNGTPEARKPKFNPGDRERVIRNLRHQT